MKKRLSAGILSYVLAISVLVSVGLSMLTLYVYYSRIEYKTYDKRIRLIENLQVAIEITKGNPGAFDLNVPHTYDLYDQGIDSTRIMRRSWGVLDLFGVEAFSGRESLSKIYTIGYRPSGKGRSAIYLLDDGRPVSVAGNTLFFEVFPPGDFKVRMEFSVSDTAIEG